MLFEETTGLLVCCFVDLSKWYLEEINLPFIRKAIFSFCIDMQKGLHYEILFRWIAYTKSRCRK